MENILHSELLKSIDKDLPNSTFEIKMKVRNPANDSRYPYNTRIVYHIGNMTLVKWGTRPLFRYVSKAADVGIPTTVLERELF